MVVPVETSTLRSIERRSKELDARPKIRKEYLMHLPAVTEFKNLDVKKTKIICLKKTLLDSLRH